MSDLSGFPKTSIISAYRRSANLRDLLVTAKLPSLTREKPLLLDRQFSKLRFIRNCRDRTVVRIGQGFSSRSRNCIYVLFCTKCDKKYVGQTKNSMSTRMYQHRNSLNSNKPDTPSIQHFRSHGLGPFKMASLQGDIGWSDRERRRAERGWIYRLGTKEPHGLNQR